MTIKQSIESNLKTALLSGDKQTATTLRGLKSVVLDSEIALGKRETGLNDNEIIGLFRKEIKKRQDSAELYKKAGDVSRANVELGEIELIKKYLPEELSEDAVAAVVDEVISSCDTPEIKQMGAIIGQVKQKLGAAGDGSVIARLVKERLS